MTKNKPKNYLKKSFLILLCALLTIGIIEGCKKDQKTQKNNTIEPAISLAKYWYESTYPISNNKQNTQSTTNSADLSQLIKPDWQHSSSYNRFNKNVIELPIDPSSKFNSSIKNGNTNELSNKAYSRSSFILINNGNSYDAYVMTLIADSAYLKNDLSKLAKNTYNKRDTDYSGLVLYFTPKGKYVCGWRYKNGKIVSPQTATDIKIENTSDLKLKPQSEEPICWDYYWIVYSNGVATSSTYLYTLCESTDGGGGGGSSDTPPPPPCQTSVHSVGQLVVNSAPVDPTGPGGDPGFPDPTNGGCGTVSPGGTVSNPPVPQKDPCLQKADIKSRADNAVIKNQNTQIATKLAQDANEWGTEQVLASLSGSVYENAALRTDNSPNSFTPNFTWNSTSGYTIGFSHDHPAGDAPSPDDIFQLIQNLVESPYNTDLITSGAAKINFYKNNVSTTIITKNCSYVVTVNNWANLSTLYSNYQSDKAKFDSDIADKGGQYASTNGLSPQAGSEYALLDTFGDAINLYKAPVGTTNFSPIIVSPTLAVINKNCP